MANTTNISALTPVTTTAQNLSNLILAVPQISSGIGGLLGLSSVRNTQGYQPQNPPTAIGTPALTTSQPPALLFHYEGEQTVAIESDITDHYVEDNTAVQDQIALRPETITTHGFIGELNDVPPAALAILQMAANSLTAIASYTPELTLSAQIAYDTAFQLYQTAAVLANSAVQSWNTLSGSSGDNVIGSNGLVGPNGFSIANPVTGQIAGTQSLQQSYFQQFYGYWRNRTLFTVQTPWAVFQNMAIQRLRAIQDAETLMITDFEVTFKMIRTVQSVAVLPQTLGAGRNGIASQSTVSLGAGSVGPTVAPTSVFGSSYGSLSP